MAVQISGNDITVPRDTTVTRNLTVGGVLTYEDVTNVDSVGLVTARSGIEIGARPGVAASISVDGNAIFSGITTVGSHMAVGGVTPETFGGGYVTLEVAGSTNDNGGVFKSATSGSAGSGSSGIEMLMNTDPVGGSINVVTTHPLKFSTANTERARFDTGGRLLIGTTTEGNASADDLTIAGSDNVGITIRSGTAHQGAIYFSDATSGNAEFDGFIVYDQNSRELRFGTQQATRMRVDAGGRLLIGGSSALEISGHTPRFQMQGTDHNTQTLSIVSNSGDANPAYLFLSKQRSGSVGGSTIVQDGDRIGEIRFNGHDGNDFAHETAIIASEVDGTPGTNDMPGRLVFYTTADGAGAVSERMRITAAGNVGVGINSPTGKFAVSDGSVIAEINPFNASSGVFIGTRSNHHILFKTNATERMRLDTSGRLSVGTSNHSSNTGIGIKLAYDSTNPSVNTVINQSAGNHSFYHLYNTNATHNAYRFYVQVNGGVANHSGNNVNLSDERMKKNITNMGSVYDTFKKFTFKDFNYIDDGASDSKKHGLIAQDVETIDSDLITEDFKIAPDSEGNDVYRKALKEEQFMMIGMKALQEAMTKIETLEAEVAALKSS